MLESTKAAGVDMSHDGLADGEQEAATIILSEFAKDPEDWRGLMEYLNLDTDRVLLVQYRNKLRQRRKGRRP